MGQISKLDYVNTKLGANPNQQDTTRVVYDSVSAAVSVAGVVRTLKFFDTFANKTTFQCNIQTNKLDASESMVIKSVRFIGQQIPSIFNGTHTNMNIFVGNQCVVKNFPVDFYIQPTTSPIRISAGSFDAVEVRLLTDIVIPPQVSFYVTLDIVGAVVATAANVTCELQGYGTLYSAGNQF